MSAAPTMLVQLTTEQLGKLIGAECERAVRNALASRGVDVDEYLDTEGAATLLGVHVRTVVRLSAKPGFPVQRIGRLYRFKRSALLAWLEEQSRTGRRQGGSR